MANSNDPVEALRKAFNAYTVSQEAMVKVSQEIQPTTAPAATPEGEATPKAGQ